MLFALLVHLTDRGSAIMCPWITLFFST